MNAFQGSGRCPHGLNRMACLQCHHDQANSRPTHEPKPKAKLPRNPIVEQVVQKSPLHQLVPEVAAPVPMGTRPDGKPAEAPKPAARARGPVPVPVMVPGQQASAPRNTVDPFSYKNDPGRDGKDGLWHPPKHESLIDRLPRHPDAKK